MNKVFKSFANNGKSKPSKSNEGAAAGRKKSAQASKGGKNSAKASKGGKKKGTLKVRPTPIYTSAVVFLSKEGHILTARKKGTHRFMLVGGKPEPGEEPRDAAVREVAEEIGLEIGRGDLDLVGMWRTKAANESGRDVLGTAYLVKFRLEDTPTPSHEIEELRWLDPAGELPGDLAPLLQTRIMPALAERGDIDYPDAPPALPWDTDHLTDYMKEKLPEDRR